MTTTNTEPVYLNTDLGREWLAESNVAGAYSSLSARFECQQTQTFCGVASSVTVLNALPEFPAPVEPIFYPYPLFTQQNFFSAEVSAIKPMTKVLAGGLTLDQLAEAVSAHGASVEVVHAADTNVGAFAELVAELMNDTRAFVIVNFNRPQLGQVGGGHFSPLAAHHGEGVDARVLMLDVARYKYWPAWVTVADMYAAMNTVDSDSDLTRGYLVVST